MAFNPWLVAASVLVAGLGVLHSLLGERYIVRRLLRRPNLPPLFGNDVFTKRTIRYAWHLLTLTVLALAGILLELASRATPLDRDAKATAAILAAVLALAAAWGVASTRGTHLSWVVLFVAAVLVFVGADLATWLAR